MADNPAEQDTPRRVTRRQLLWGGLAVAAAAGTAGALWPRDPAPGAAPPPDGPTFPPNPPAPAPTRKPTPSPTPHVVAEAPPDIDVADLPLQDVFSVTPDLPIDPRPLRGFTGLHATPRFDEIPVFAEPDGPPVAKLPAVSPYGGTVLPIIERRAGTSGRLGEIDGWDYLLVSGRAQQPSNGQLTGWVRTNDIDVVTLPSAIDVSITDRTVDIVSADGTRERVAEDFGWGTDATPTPIGRTFVMTTQAGPEWWLRGHLIVYLGVQSETLGGFNGSPVAITAFHYYDTRSGSISNGCIRLAAEQIDRLCELPEGTFVTIRA